MTNWKTFLLGLLLAVWVAIQPIITNGDFDLIRDWKTLIGAALIAAVSYFMKDKDVTGVGTSARRVK